MFRVGCWMGRVVLECTWCHWQDPSAETIEGEESRALTRLTKKARDHAWAAHNIDEIRHSPMDDAV